MKTANLAIVFTDIKGFTERTSHQTLEQNGRLLEVHAELLTPLFRSFSGRVVKTIGDAFLVTFESPTQAVLCGIAIQDKLWYHNRGAPQAEQLEVRVAINVGEVRLEGNDVFGEPVNIASRVEGITEAGEVFFTEAVYLSMNKAEVPSEEVGAFELKGIPGKVRVYRVPKAPYRVESQPAAGEQAQPPFGNLGLSKATAVTAGLGERAADLGTRAAALGSQLVERTGNALADARRRRWPVPRHWVGGALAALMFLGLAGVWLGRSKVDGAIEAVASAPEGERAAKAEVARKLIAEETDKGQAGFDRGRLDQALGQPRSAIGHFRASAKDGNDRAKAKLVDLLDSDDCRVRESAAEAIGELKLTRARSKLERLADKGGADDDQIPVFGCNSRRAAADALRRLE